MIGEKSLNILFVLYILLVVYWAYIAFIVGSHETWKSYIFSFQWILLGVVLFIDSFLKQKKSYIIVGIFLIGLAILNFLQT